MDRNENRYEGTPSDLEDTYGVWVSVTRDSDPEDVRMFWAYVYTPFQDWAEWWVLIDGLIQANISDVLGDG